MWLTEKVSCEVSELTLVPAWGLFLCWLRKPPWMRGDWCQLRTTSAQCVVPCWVACIAADPRSTNCLVLRILPFLSWTSGMTAFLQVTGRLQIDNHVSPEESTAVRTPSHLELRQPLCEVSLCHHIPPEVDQNCVIFQEACLKWGVWTTPVLGEPPEGCMLCLGRLAQDSMMPPCLWGCPMPRTTTQDSTYEDVEDTHCHSGLKPTL